MSLMRQVGWLLAAVLLFAISGAIGVNLHAARATLSEQLEVKNRDNAQSLALALSQQRGDPRLIELLLAAQFDTGLYSSIRLVGPDGGVAFERHAEVQTHAAPAWFAALLPIDAATGVAQVSDGWRALGRVELISQAAYAHDELWRGSTRSAALLVALGVIALAVAAAAVRRLRVPMDATVAQANALVAGRYLIVDEPQVPELQRVARAMNGMVERGRRLFEAQAGQMEQLRQEANEDRVTGLAHRVLFLKRLAALLSQDGGAASGTLLLARVADLAATNRNLGRDATDRALQVLARSLTEWPAAGAFGARLNGADFALVLPHIEDPPSSARALSDALRMALTSVAPSIVAHVGAAAWHPGQGVTPGSLLASADLALARAEAGAPFGAAAEVAHDARTEARGEQHWRRRLLAAIDAQRASLAEFPVIDSQSRVVHRECPLLVQLEEEGAYEPAVRWLPLARRTQLMPSLDLTAVRLALAAIDADGQPRAVHLAPASLTDGPFVAQLREALARAPRAAAGMWLEVPEDGVRDQHELLRAFAAMVRPLSVRFGLEHAGQAMHGAPRLYEVGLDYVKLDSALLRGVAHDEAVRRFVCGSVALLRSLSVLVCAQGIDDDADARALWDCGIDAITGPWASARVRDEG